MDRLNRYFKNLEEDKRGDIWQCSSVIEILSTSNAAWKGGMGKIKYFRPTRDDNTWSSRAQLRIQIAEIDIDGRTWGGFDSNIGPLLPLASVKPPSPSNFKTGDMCCISLGKRRRNSHVILGKNKEILGIKWRMLHSERHSPFKGLMFL